LYDLTAIDFGVWDILGMDDEAQRNIDYWVATKSKSLSTGPVIKKKLHFFLQNPLRVPGRVTFLVPQEVHKISDMVKTAFSVVRDKKSLRLELPVKGENKIHGFTTNLAAGKNAGIELELSVTDKFMLKEDVVLNFPITIEGNRNSRHKWPKGFSVPANQTLIGGVTLVIRMGSADVSGKILLKGAVPPKQCAVIITTQDGETVEEVNADKGGTFEIKGISPGVMRIHAVSGDLKSPEKLLVLKNGARKEIFIDLSGGKQAR
jgi:hypothetical protein